MTNEEIIEYIEKRKHTDDIVKIKAKVIAEQEKQRLEMALERIRNINHQQSEVEE